MKLSLKVSMALLIATLCTMLLPRMAMSAVRAGTESGDTFAVVCSVANTDPMLVKLKKGQKVDPKAVREWMNDCGESGSNGHYPSTVPGSHLYVPVDSYTFVVWFEQNRQVVDPSEVNWEKAHYKVEGGQSADLRSFPVRRHPLILVPLASIEAHHAQEIQFNIVRDPEGSGEPQDFTRTSFYFKNKRSIEGYRALGEESFFWIPAGLISTNFDTGDNGLIFSAAPVSLAFGMKWNFERVAAFNYLGASVTGGWNIVELQSGDQGDLAADRISIGLLGDVSGWFYVGGSYLVDLGDGESPGVVATVGVGPNLLEFLGAGE
ncbi:hypothetical protein FIV42_10515 [Persicimonas caeni]|uniref:Transporter n=1 Tax=Persicimonas caeni TaxID=2292766 RepID=A0A4Y6PSE5_PERCE|nr:hypothetical protein [Persicimonas caeni]QDG51153.1 hypothetical protein FIV42_10515 [Persicimonas caeni]QED32374.1 hypothetical protein FRD00_10510 [Persicimonas caeni]